MSESSFVKTGPGTAINTDHGGLEAYKKRKAAMREQKGRFEALEEKVDRIQAILEELLLRTNDR